MAEFALQGRCVHCLAEQYIPAVWAISTRGGPCTWCRATLQPMTHEQYRQALAAAFAQKAATAPPK